MKGLTLMKNVAVLYTSYGNDLPGGVVSAFLQGAHSQGKCAQFLTGRQLQPAAHKQHPFRLEASQ